MTVAGSGASQTLASVTGTNAQTQAGVILLPGESSGPINAVVGSLGTDMVGFEPVGNVHWGRWVNGSITGEDTPGVPVTETPTTGVHYIYGEATSNTVIAAKTGSFAYSDIGGTTPTDNHGNQASSFSFGPINVNFTTRQGSVSAVTLSGAGSNFSFSNVPFAFQLRPGQGVGFAADASNFGTCTGACAGAPGGADIAFSGVFLGPTGNLLGTSWHLAPHINPIGNPLMFTGARLFKCPTCP
jgi:hypothetical protein